MIGTIGFDALFDKEDVNYNGVSISHGLTNDIALVSSPQGGTFIEPVNPSIPLSPIKVSQDSSDYVGFFGSSSELAVLSFQDSLKIMDISTMKTVGEYTIQPGSVFVSSSTRASRIGAVSENGQVVVIDDKLNVHKTPLKVSPHYEVLWSQHVKPLGYMWAGDITANIYIHPSQGGEGVTFSSTKGISILSSWESPEYRRNEVFISTHDKPNILRKLSAEDSKPVLEDVFSFNEGCYIKDVVSRPNGKPAVIIGSENGIIKTAVASSNSNISRLLQKVVSNQTLMSSVKCLGKSSLAIWEQSPVSSTRASILDYSVISHPKHVLSSYKANNEKLPVYNKLFNLKTSDGQDITYRLVSPYNPKSFLADTCAVIPDYSGHVYAGEFSHTVKILYDLGIPVAVLSVNKNKRSRKLIDENATLDMIDVAYHLRENRVAQSFTVIGSADSAVSSVSSLNVRKTPIKNAIIFNPTKSSVSLRSKNWEKVTLVNGGEGEIGNEHERANNVTLPNKINDNYIHSLLSSLM